MELTVAVRGVDDEVNEPIVVHVGGPAEITLPDATLAGTGRHRAGVVANGVKRSLVKSHFSAVRFKRLVRGWLGQVNLPRQVLDVMAVPHHDSPLIQARQ